MFPPLVFPSACLSCLPFFCLRSTPFLVRLWSSPSSHLSILAPRQPLPPVNLSAQSAANLPSYPLSSPPTVRFSSCLPTSCLALLLTCPSLVCPTSAVYPSFVCPTPAVYFFLCLPYIRCIFLLLFAPLLLSTSPHVSSTPAVDLFCCLPCTLSIPPSVYSPTTVYPSSCLPYMLSTSPPICRTRCLPLLLVALNSIYLSLCLPYTLLLFLPVPPIVYPSLVCSTLLAGGVESPPPPKY